MPEYTIELDAVHETMVRELAGEDVETEEFLNNAVENFIYNAYQQSK